MTTASNVPRQFELIPVESDESTESDLTLTQHIPKKIGILAFLATVFALCVISVGLGVKGSTWTATPIGDAPREAANLRAATLLQEEVVSPAMASAKKAFGNWAKGKYALEGGKCQANAPSILQPSFTLRTSAAIMNAGIGNVYYGVDGLCAWIKDLEKFDFRTFAPGFYDLGDGRIIQTAHWNPSLKTGAKADHNVTDASIVHWQHGKMSSFKYFFAEPLTVERLFAPSTPEQAPQEATGDFKAWLTLRGAWAVGNFSGDKCQQNVGHFVSPSFTMVNIPYVRGIGMEASYSGLDGYCAWIKDLEQFDFSTMKPSDFPVSDDEFLMINTYTPALAFKKGAKSMQVKAKQQGEDVAFITFQAGKMLGFNYFFSHPDSWSSLFSIVDK